MRVRHVLHDRPRWTKEAMKSRTVCAIRDIPVLTMRARFVSVVSIRTSQAARLVLTVKEESMEVPMPHTQSQLVLAVRITQSLSPAAGTCQIALAFQALLGATEDHAQDAC